MTKMNLPPEGLRIRISISDPWDFYTENGPVALGRIVSVNEQRGPEFKIELDAPVKEKKLRARELYARFRGSNDSIERLLAGELVGCNFSNVPHEDWEKQAPEARIGFIGGLQLD